MKPWSPTIKIAAVALAGLFALVLVVSRSGRHTEEELGGPNEPATRLPPIKQSDRVYKRLEQLRAAHARSAGGEGTEHVRARPNIPPAPQQKWLSGVHAAPQTAGSDGRNAQDQARDEAADEPDADDIPGLSRAALQDPDAERRLAAITLLGATEDPQAIPALTQALSDQDEEVRMAALQALSDYTDEPPVEAIESALNDPSADIRFEAVDVLSDIGGDRARSAVERALNDPDEDVRALAEGILDIDETYAPEQSEPPPGAAPAQ
jgi:hypothetical protein